MKEGSIVRDHAKHPKLCQIGPWGEAMSTEAGPVREQTIELAATRQAVPAPPPWCRIDIQL